jgi:hypothetical protein
MEIQINKTHRVELSTPDENKSGTIYYDVNKEFIYIDQSGKSFKIVHKFVGINYEGGNIHIQCINGTIKCSGRAYECSGTFPCGEIQRWIKAFFKDPYHEFYLSEE